jgi:predicted nucleic acid-binding protein
MTEGLADTTIFIANEWGRPLRDEGLPDQLAVSVITVGELRAGCSPRPMSPPGIDGWPR